MTGRHVLGREARNSSTSTPGSAPATEDYPVGLLNGGTTEDEGLVSPGAVISTDTHVGVDQEQLVHRHDAKPSPADPDALVQHGLVGEGHELE